MQYPIQVPPPLPMPMRGPPGAAGKRRMQRRHRRGADFVLPDVPILESPVWSDDDEDTRRKKLVNAPPHPARQYPAAHPQPPLPFLFPKGVFLQPVMQQRAYAVPPVGNPNHNANAYQRVTDELGLEAAGATTMVPQPILKAARQQKLCSPFEIPPRHFSFHSRPSRSTAVAAIKEREISEDTKCDSTTAAATTVSAWQHSSPESGSHARSHMRSHKGREGGKESAASLRRDAHYDEDYSAGYPVDSHSVFCATMRERPSIMISNAPTGAAGTNAHRRSQDSNSRTFFVSVDPPDGVIAEGDLDDSMYEREMQGRFKSYVTARRLHQYASYAPLDMSVYRSTHALPPGHHSSKSMHTTYLAWTPPANSNGRSSIAWTTASTGAVEDRGRNYENEKNVASLRPRVSKLGSAWSHCKSQAPSVAFSAISAPPATTVLTALDDTEYNLIADFLQCGNSSMHLFSTGGAAPTKAALSGPAPSNPGGATSLSDGMMMWWDYFSHQGSRPGSAAPSEAALTPLANAAVKLPAVTKAVQPQSLDPDKVSPPFVASENPTAAAIPPPPARDAMPALSPTLGQSPTCGFGDLSILPWEYSLYDSGAAESPNSYSSSQCCLGSILSLLSPQKKKKQPAAKPPLSAVEVCEGGNRRASQVVDSVPDTVHPSFSYGLGGWYASETPSVAATSTGSVNGQRCFKRSQLTGNRGVGRRQ